MGSHHFVGNGHVTADLVQAAKAPEDLERLIAAQVRACGLEVLDRNVVRFDNGGLTLVWVLAESHLVVHYWAEEGFATLDLHVCDYESSNATRAVALVEGLTTFCFTPGSETWHELHLETPSAVSSQ
jgi:S-adenosylmethionine/arginine decarboxylase-like enzyme